MPLGQTEQRVHILSCGPFGQAVARHVRNFLPGTQETVVDGNTISMAETWPNADVHIVASWRPVPQLCAFLEEISYRWKRIFVPVIMDSGTLRLGPVVVPGASCWTCWVQRSRQLDPWRDEQSALLQYYSENPQAGPKGFLESFSLMGAARIIRVVEELEADGMTPGFIWEFNMVRRTMASTVLVGMHGCPRCGNQRPAATRTILQLKQDLDFLKSDVPPSRFEVTDGNPAD